MKLIVAGSREFNNYELLKQQLIPYISGITEIVSGTAKGADRLGERFANEYKIPIKRFPADWSNLGKSAGYIRNELMAKYADYLIVFRVNKSKGSTHMYNLGIKYLGKDRVRLVDLEVEGK